ncbi:hypothetical protein E2C01_091966 [Portunus trituberculatus]|uniref:Uncharacterized protein n=1 Tax=Portunus trituberculatus TaxID=210409 RepID=A0A5B7JFC1_PORTR|nr:hypothetical protein [Portunus trituberculatus]
MNYKAKKILHKLTFDEITATVQELFPSMPGVAGASKLFFDRGQGCSNAEGDTSVGQGCSTLNGSGELVKMIGKVLDNNSNH